MRARDAGTLVSIFYMPSTIIHVPHSHANLLNYISAKVVLHWWQSADSRMQVFSLSLHPHGNECAGWALAISQFYPFSHRLFLSLPRLYADTSEQKRS
jgi:hypothetical protein